ncbi:hypothetical protein ACFVTC_09645 [Streptomyces sp. NPDC057950]|uniref:hypothetical protein n=1 Tax=Streptomyces sp. NPDC057950 TaxID=3346288 RepID=UPI0036E25F22
MEYQGTREQTVPGPETVSRPSSGARPGPPPAPDTASEVARWAAFSCVLVPVVLVWFGTSLAGAAGTALGLAAVTTACLVLLRQSERGAARMRADERAPHRARHGRSGPRERGPRDRTRQDRDGQDRDGRDPAARNPVAGVRDPGVRDRDGGDHRGGDRHAGGRVTGVPGPGGGPVGAPVPAPGAQDVADTHIMNGLPGRGGSGAHRGGRRGAGKKPVD